MEVCEVVPYAYSIAVYIVNIDEACIIEISESYDTVSSRATYSVLTDIER